MFRISRLARQVAQQVPQMAQGAQAALARPTDLPSVLARLGVRPAISTWVGGRWVEGSGSTHTVLNPATNEALLEMPTSTVPDVASSVAAMAAGHHRWASTPAPKRGEIVREIGMALRARKEDLARLITLEMGKIYQEALGEVQEGIDICDYAVGTFYAARPPPSTVLPLCHVLDLASLFVALFSFVWSHSMSHFALVHARPSPIFLPHSPPRPGMSRAIGGPVLPSERGDHMMMEKWHPLTGPVGIITAFNFPCAVYFWNLALALICGNTHIFKPAPSGSLVGLACARVCFLFSPCSYSVCVFRCRCTSSPPCPASLRPVLLSPSPPCSSRAATHRSCLRCCVATRFTASVRS